MPLTVPFDKALHDLLEQPFGPYLEETILSEKCRFTASKRLQLSDFQLAYNDEPTGFDRTEFDGHLTPSNVEHLAPILSGSQVLFRGILSLQTHVHISGEGLKLLNHDFQERITRSIMNGVQAAKKYPTLDLESLFTMKAKQKDAQRYNISVLIQGHMHSTASFMRSDLVPNGLLFHTANAAKTKFRIYQIVSMDVETYKLSRTFLFRHHTLKTMRDILNRAGGDGVPARKCTPQWFLEHYFLHHAYPSHSKWQRINSLEDVESSDEGFGKHLECPPDAQTDTPRHLRTVHKNEVWSIFGSHSQWIFALVEKHKDLKGKVNTESWKNFTTHVPQLRQRALINPDTDGKWGLRDEQEGDQMDKATVSDIPPLSSSEPKAAESQPKSTRGRKKKKPFVKPYISVTHPPAPLPSRAPIPAPQAQAEDQQDNIYDSDFTQGSLSPTDCHATSWLPHSIAVHPPSPPGPSLCALIPHEMLIPPTLPVDMLWHCPIGGTCSYIINLCAPSDTNLKSISANFPQDEVVYFLKKGWKSNDQQVFIIFHEMVNAHWEDHLKELDIKFVRQGDASSFEWIHPQRHTPWPPKRWTDIRAHKQQLLMSQQKQESPEV